MARGRKPTLNASAGLPVDPPACLTKEERGWWRHFRRLAAATAGTNLCAGDESLLLVACRQRQRLERLSALLYGEEVASRDGTGAFKLNPLLAELRAQEAEHRQVLNCLRLTPRSRGLRGVRTDAAGPAIDRQDAVLLKILGDG